MRKLFIVAEISDAGLTGYVIRPREPLDNRRWYFNRWIDAESHANYLERTETALLGIPMNGGHQ